MRSLRKHNSINARKVKFPGHALFVDEAERFNLLVQRFLEGTPAR
jgi:hypothetical protein